MNVEIQRSNYEYFQKELPSLLSDPLKVGKFVVVDESAIQGVFDTVEAAYRFAAAKLSKGFIIQQVLDERSVVDYLATAVI